MPAGPVNVIREDPAEANVLYLGTDFGAFVSTNGGASGTCSAAILDFELAADFDQFPERRPLDGGR